MNTLSNKQAIRLPKLKQFPQPESWEILQKNKYNLNDRVDCAINSLAFVGAMDRETAENTAQIVNDRKGGVFTHDIRAYVETKDGYVKKPHQPAYFSPQTSADMSNLYGELKNGFTALISIHRLNGASGHTATIIRTDDKFMVFDPQTEQITQDVCGWLDQEHAAWVEVITEVDKRAHCRSESNVSVRRVKPDQEESTNYKFSRIMDENEVVAFASFVSKYRKPHQQTWRLRNLVKIQESRRAKKEQTDHQFQIDMERVGFAKYLN